VDDAALAGDVAVTAMREETEESKKVRTPLAHLFFSQWLTA
jgi:hypothetical protein